MCNGVTGEPVEESATDELAHEDSAGSAARSWCRYGSPAGKARGHYCLPEVPGSDAQTCGYDSATSGSLQQTLAHAVCVKAAAAFLHTAACVIVNVLHMSSCLYAASESNASLSCYSAACITN